MELKNLVERAKDGDSKAWNSLFGGTKDMVYFTALKLCGNKTDAEDIVQETYIKAVKNISSLTAPEAFVSWMRMIAVNVSRDYLAKKSPTVFGSDESDALLINTPEVEEDFLPAEYASRRETARIIMRIIDSLPEKQRATVILYYYNQVPVAEIARIMNVSENTVKSRLNYARVQIKEQVEDLEKKGTKLHGAVPFLGIALKEAAKDYTLSAEAASKIAGIFAAGTAGAAAAATATAAATTGGILAKLASLPLVTKIIAGVLSAAVLLGASAAVVSNLTDNTHTVSDNIVHTDSPSVTLTAKQADEYREFDVLSLFEMTRSEIEEKFGSVYDTNVYDYGGYSVLYTFVYENAVDNLVLDFEDGGDYPTNVQVLGGVFNLNGLCTEMSIDDAKKNIESQGFSFVCRNESSDEWGDFTEENYVNGNLSLYIMYDGDTIGNISIWRDGVIIHETTESIETTAPVETTAEPTTTSAPVIDEPLEKTLLYTFKQNELESEGYIDAYIPFLKMYSDGTFEFRANIYYGILACSGTWRDAGDGNYVLNVAIPTQKDVISAREFKFYYTGDMDYGVITLYSDDYLGVTESGAKFELILEQTAPDATTNEGAHKIFEEFRVTSRSSYTTSYAYADVTHDGIEELIVMTNSEGIL